ncbi:hypothetical protein HYS72_02930 [Candidatus Pacearchaeota archaeon]|nr:hypothetical protein [Candidatus Pacearchaeota archaeon]MBI2056840.1 hypothetical protein [Candidatus Pacearchaeota archaeon]
MFIPTLNKKKKIAVSTMIGYILLITFAIVIAGVVYQWLKTYVPKEGIACPDGVSIYVSDSAYNDISKKLELTLTNNGQFSVGGIYIYYSNSSSQEIAVNDLSKFVPKPKQLNPGVILGTAGKNSFEPGGEDEVLTFDINGLTDQEIYAVEITPIRWQEEKNRISIVSCANAKTKKILDLTIDQEIIPEINLQNL